MKRVTVISTLPPLKGISPYTVEFLNGICNYRQVEFIGFKHLYPDMFYPGGTKDQHPLETKHGNVEKRVFLSWYNPITWIYAGLSAKGDIIHAQYWSFLLFPVYFVILLLVKTRGKTIVLTVHNAKLHSRNKIVDLLYKCILLLADHYIVHSENNKKVLSFYYGIPHKAIRVIPHPVIHYGVNRQLCRQKARRTLQLKKDDRVILFFGNIRPYKGLDILIQAFKQIDVPKKKLVIAGQCWNNKSSFMELIGNNDAILFHGEYIPADRVSDYFLSADLMILPYLNFDADSGAGCLALAFHLPLVVTDVGSLPELIPDRDHCLVEPGKIDDLAKRITMILMDDKLQHSLKRGIKGIEKKRSSNETGRKTRDLYEYLEIHKMKNQEGMDCE